MIEIDLSRGLAPNLSGTDAPKIRRKFFYCSVCADGKRQRGDYRRHLLEHLHKASHELTIAKLELDVVFGSQAIPELMWGKDFENLAWLGAEEAERLCQEIDQYLKSSR